MSKVKKITAAAVTAGLVLTLSAFTACGEKDNGRHDFMDHEQVIQRAKELVAENPDAFPDVEVGTKIRWLSWYDIDEKAPTAEVFKAKYGTPEPEKDDKVINYIKVVYENRYEKIASMVMADQSPDMFQFEERFYPYGVFADLFEPIDDVIDLSGKEWDNTRDIIKLFEWGGKNYAPVAQLAPSSST
ncbi:MAG: hypothetical protein FWF82_00800, partial [Oscillospiraceae bacterium]|nr:hypothetical protein [Oscillospiraceae bacterium]